MWEWTLRPEARGPEMSQVRLQVHDALVECRAADVGGAELLVWELMTNALSHGHTEAEVCIHDEGAHVRAEVSDGGDDRVELQPPDPTREGGHGLELVDALALRWGVIDRSEGKTVWFEVEGGSTDGS